MADGSVVFDTTLNTKQLEQELNRVRTKILRLQQDVQVNNGKKMALEAQLESVEKKMEEVKQKEKAFQKLGGDNAESEKLGQEHLALSEQWDKINAEIEKYNQKIQDGTQEIEQQKGVVDSLTNTIKGKAGDAAKPLNSGMNEVKTTMDSTQSSAMKLANRIVGLAKRVFIFSVITSALRALRTWFSNTAQGSSELNSAIAQLKGALQTMAAPIMQVVIPAFTALISVIARVVSVIASVVSALFGMTGKQSASAAKALNNQAKAYGGVGSAAKEAKRELMGFDQINKLNDEEDSSGGGGGSSEILPDYSLFGGIDVSKFQPLIDAIERFKQAVLPLLETLKSLGKWVYENVLVPFGMWVANSAIPAFLDVLSAAIGVINDALWKIQPIAKWIWDEILQPIASWTGGILIDWLTSISDWITRHKDTLSGVIPIVLGIAGGLYLFHERAKLVSKGIELIKGAFQIFTTALSSPITWIILLIWYITELWDSCEGFREGITTAWEGVKEFFGGLYDFFVALFTGTDEQIADAITRTVEGGKQIVEGLWTGLQAAWEWTKEKVAGIWESLIQGFKDFFGIHSPSTVMAELGDYLISGLLEGIETAWASVTEWLGGIVDEVVTTLSTAWENVTNWWLTNASPIFTAEYWAGIWKTVTDGLGQLSIVSAIQNIWNSLTSWWTENVSPIFTLEYWANVFSAIGNGLLEAIKSPINAAIEMLNNLINSINSALSFDIPAFTGPFGVEFGGYSFGVNIPNIPALAEGAVIPPNNKFLALLGDQASGTNIEAPLSTIKEAVSEVLDGNSMLAELQEQNDLLRQILAKSGTYLDGKLLSDTVSTYQARMARARG